MGDYLSLRYEGSEHSPLSTVKELNWKPASYDVLKRELNLLASILRHAVDELGYVNVGNHRLLKASVTNSLGSIRGWASGVLTGETSKNDFFVHLKAARIHWARVYGRDAMPMPPVIRRQPHSPPAVNYFTTEEALDLIRRETNPMFRAIWTAGAFGGPRISEQLNTWQVDILPPDHRHHFFSGAEKSSDSTALYLRAHPSACRYTGKVGSFSTNRNDYLARHYGLRPRSELSPEDSLYAGWKGTVPTGEAYVHQIMWCDDFASSLFNECMGEIRDFHLHHRTSLRHPWLFVNIGNTDAYGEPIKMSRVGRAFEAACHRVSIIPYRNGRNIHGLRHHYAGYLRKTLRLDEETIKIAMGHASIESQRVYGTKIDEANRHILNARSGVKNAV